MKGENRGPRKEEVEERIVSSVYARPRTEGEVRMPGYHPTASTTRKKSDDPLAQELEDVIRAEVEVEEKMTSLLGRLACSRSVGACWVVKDDHASEGESV